MKILLIGNHLSGHRNNLNISQDLAQHLNSARYQVNTTSNKNNKLLRLADMIYTIWHHRHEYDIAQMDVFSGQAFVWAYLSAKLLKNIHKPFILTLHGGNLPVFSIHHPSQVKWLLNHANAVTVPSRYLQDTMRSYRNDLILIPNALDINLYSCVKHDPPKPILVWLRAFHEIYNPGLAVRVLDILQKETPESRLIMVGPDKGDGSLQKTKSLAIQFGVEDFIEFSGGVPKQEVPMWLNRGDIFINTTNYDNTPVSVMEAMACGLCIVSTNVGGVPYLIEDGLDGLLVPVDNAEAMAAAVRRIITEPGLAARLSTNARKKAESFDWHIVLPRWEQLIEEVIRHGHT